VAIIRREIALQPTHLSDVMAAWTASSARTTQPDRPGSLLPLIAMAVLSWAGLFLLFHNLG
jgi:hypothetical protein